MPVHDAINFTDGYFDQIATARAASASPGIGLVDGTMGGTHQVLTGQVVELVGLVVHFHRHMSATVQVGIRRAFKPNCKRSAGLPGVTQVERHRVPTVDQIPAVTQRDQRRVRII